MDPLSVGTKRLGEIVEIRIYKTKYAISIDGSRFTSVKDIEIQVPVLSPSQAVELRCLRADNMRDQALEYPPILKVRVG